MFNNLVESDLHTHERVRRSWFFLGTLAAYAVLLMIAGVASIYAYDAHLEEQTNEYLVTFIPPPLPDEPQAPRPTPQPAAPNRANAGGRESVRTEFIERISQSTRAPGKPSAAAPTVPELPAGNVRLGSVNMDAGSPQAISRMPGGPGGDDSTGKPRVVVDIPDTPPPPKVAPTPPRNLVKTGGVLNGEARVLPKPTYPQTARMVKASGVVTVQVLIDETGKVISAQAVSGHPLLRAAAVQAAYQARFTPTYLSQQAVKVSGVITYNFVL